MATTIKLKNGSGAPLAGDLVQGEPAFDLTNKRLYTEDSGGTVIEVGTNPGTDVTFADNRKAIFGAGSDLQIYHNGSHSIIADAGTGHLKLLAADLRINNAADTETFIAAYENSKVDIYYDNSVKLSTTATGIDVTGTITTDGLNFDVADGVEIDALESILFNIDSDNNQTGRVFGVRTNSADTLFTIQDTGNVGIGETTPSARLDVAGSDTVGIVYDGSANAYIRADANTGSQAGFSLAINGVQQGVLTYDATDEFKITSPTSLRFITNLAERMRIDSSGNVGIGTASPATPLHINGTTAAQIRSQATTGFAGLHNTNSSGNFYHMIDNSTGAGFSSGAYARVIYSDGAYPMAFYTNANERMRIDSSGRVFIGKTSDNDNTAGHTLHSSGLVVHTRDSSFAAIFNRTTNDGDIAQFKKDGAIVGSIGSNNSGGTPVLDISANSTSGIMRMLTSGSERMRIDSSGNLLLGTTTLNHGSEEFAIAPDSSIAISTDKNADYYALWFMRSGTNTGSVYVTSTSTFYYTTSDERLKENIVDAPAGNIDAIRVRSFDWKADGSHQTYGMVAQELVDVAPEAVTQGNPDDDMWAVDYSKLVPMMIKEIQDLKAKVKELESR